MNDNPYRPPANNDSDASLPEVNRDWLFHEIQQALEQLPAIEQLEALTWLAEDHKSPDPIVNLVLEEIGGAISVDSLTVDQASWDRLQRNMLLLRTTAKVVIDRKTRWSWQQLWAFGCVVISVVAGSELGWPWFFSGTAAFLLPAYLQDRFKRTGTQRSTNKPACEPFCCIADVANAARSSDFRKTRFAPPSSEAAINNGWFSKQASLVSKVLLALLAIVFSHMIVFAAMFPDRVGEVRVSKKSGRV